jgi:hypothetical protein
MVLKIGDCAALPAATPDGCPRLFSLAWLGSNLNLTISIGSSESLEEQQTNGRVAAKIKTMQTIFFIWIWLSRRI